MIYQFNHKRLTKPPQREMQKTKCHGTTIHGKRVPN